jgi:glycosyltransferase EpsF
MKYVLQLLPSLELAGIQTVIMNYYRNIDRQRLQFDFIVADFTDPFYKDEIEKLGGRIFVIKNSKTILGKVKFLYSLYKLIKQKKGHYEAFHSHAELLAGFTCAAAFFAGIKKCFITSHNTQYRAMHKNIIKFISLLSLRLFPNHRLAVSYRAGLALYGKMPFEVTNNGIDLERFYYNVDIRKKLREKLNLLGIGEGKFAVGHIGRFELQKNHTFLIDIFYEIRKRDKNAVLLLLGIGSLQDSIREKVKNLGISQSVQFLGSLSNISDYYQAMDCFLLPSLHEGLPVVAVEAQACALPCFISDAIADETSIVNTTKIPLKACAKEWADIIFDKMKNFNRTDQTEKIRQAGFDIKTVAQKMQKMYLDKI